MDLYAEGQRHASFQLAAAALLVQQGKITVDELLEQNVMALALVGFKASELWAESQTPEDKK